MGAERVFGVVACVLAIGGLVSACAVDVTDEPATEELGSVEQAMTFGATNVEDSAALNSGALAVFGDGKFVGTGALIARDWVVTSAMSFADGRVRPDGVQVRAGNVSDPAAQTRNVLAVYKVKVGNANDRAILLRLASRFDGLSVRDFAPAIVQFSRCFSFGPSGKQLVRGDSFVVRELSDEQRQLTTFGPGPQLEASDRGAICLHANGDIMAVSSGTLLNETPIGWDGRRLYGAARDIMQNCGALEPHSPTFCSATCPCLHGGGDCDSNSECGTGLVCDSDVGPAFAAAPTADVCVKSACSTNAMGSDSYCSSNCPCGYGGGDCDSNSQCQWGLVCTQGVGLGFNYTADTGVCLPAACGGRTLGSSTFCSTECPCGFGGGHCESHEECVRGLLCSPGLGADFGFSSSTAVCVPP